jgi:flagellar biosynthesis/type III secretory pathway ATPase
VSVGAYARGSDPMLDKAIALWPQLEAFYNKAFSNVPGGKIQYKPLNSFSRTHNAVESDDYDAK